MTTPPVIGDAVLADLPEILVIYNEVIRNSTAVPCYRHSVEHSLHVRADCRGRGIGRLLIGTLIARARALGKHVMIAGIDADNAVSIRLHESLGFKVVGHLHEVGRKFGRWLDLKFLELRL